MESWVLAIYASQNQLSDEDKNDYFVNVKAYDDNLVYANVRTNSDSKIRLALYRVNADGYLEQGTLNRPIGVLSVLLMSNKMRLKYL